MLGERLPERSIDAAIAGLGTFALVAQTAVYAGLTLRALLPLSALAVGAAWVAGAWPRSDAPSPPREANAAPPRGWPAALLLAGLALVAWHLGALPLPVAVGLGALSLLTAPVAPDRPPDLRATRSDLAFLMMFGLLCSAFVLYVHRPGQDDSYYLNAAQSALDHPDLPLLSFDGMHGDPSLPIHQVAHRAQTGELAVAVAAGWAGTPASVMYYQVFPAMAAFAVPLVLWSLARALGASRAAPVALVALGVMLLWGGADLTWGNYGLVRIFQGKSVFVTLLAPCVALAAIRFATAPTPAGWARLLLAQAAGAGATSSGLLLGPLASGLALLAFAPRGAAGVRALGLGLLASAPLGVVLLVLRHEAASSPVPSTADFRFDVPSVVGGGWRGPLALFGWVALPVLASLSGAASRGLVRWVGLLWVTVAGGLLGAGLGAISDHFVWRVFWIVPAPLLLGLALVRAAEAPRWRGLPLGPLAAAGAVVAFATSGISTFTERNGVHYGWLEDKVHPWAARVGDRLRAVAGPDDVVLAPAKVAGPMVGRPNPPKMVWVRHLYADNLERVWGRPLTERRRRLARLAEGEAMDPDRARGDLDALCVRAFAARRALRSRRDLQERFAEMGFSRSSGRDFDVYHRAPPCEPGEATPPVDPPRTRRTRRPRRR